MSSASPNADAIPQEPAPGRDPYWFSPVFVLAPPRSHSSVVVTMIGRHPQLFGFPELSLFRQETVSELLVDAPGYRGPPVAQQLAGLLRSLAQLHQTSQDNDAVHRALAWLQCRQSWRSQDVMDHLFRLVVPRTPVEKSPENSNTQESLKRLADAYPRARYLHLTRHPVPTIRSMSDAWSGLGYWDVPDELMPHFCAGSWYFHHVRLVRFVSVLPPDRALRVRSEDVLNSPLTELPRICEWLGVDTGEDAIAAMLRPQDSPFAHPGFVSAAGGNDPAFLADPKPHAVVDPPNVEFPPEWLIDPWMKVSCVELAHQLGYPHARE